MKNFIQGVPFEIKCIANEKRQDHEHTIDELIIPLQILQTLLARKPCL